MNCEAVIITYLQSINTGGDMRYSLLFNLLIIASNFQRTFHHFLSANNTLRDDASLPPPPPQLPSPLPHPQSTSPSTPMLIPSSTSLDGTSGMPPFADFLDPPTCRKGGTTASKVLSTDQPDYLELYGCTQARTLTHRAKDCEVPHTDTPSSTTEEVD